MLYAALPGVCVSSWLLCATYKQADSDAGMPAVCARPSCQTRSTGKRCRDEDGTAFDRLPHEGNATPPRSDPPDATADTSSCRRPSSDPRRPPPAAALPPVGPPLCPFASAGEKTADISNPK